MKNSDEEKKEESKPIETLKELWKGFGEIYVNDHKVRQVVKVMKD